MAVRHWNTCHAVWETLTGWGLTCPTSEIQGRSLEPKATSSGFIFPMRD